MILINSIASKGTRMSYLRRVSTAALALFLALTPAAAWAGPDQDKDWIVTGQHVDAPIPVWHDDTNSFSLNTINMPMEKTVLWIPKAWTGTGDKDEAKSQLVIPSGRPDLAFLGGEGTVLNAAPQNPGPGNAPIWAGLGAGEIGDTDKFEGETYTLDLVSVDGPGRMEMFIDNGDSVNRFLSSHDLAYRSVYNPRHTHLYTTFTQPGRYVAHYKMTARSADGTAIYSSPITPLVWQVGGANPAEGSIKDIDVAYSAARAERTDSNSATPTLTLSHHADRAHPGDNHLTDITVDTGVPTDRGRAWITVNGYFLTEVAVEAGRATVSELLGAEAGAVQAIYIPDDSASARWISQAAQYSQKDTEPVTVGGADTILGPSNPDPAPVWNPDSLPVSSRRVDVSYDLKPGTTDQYTATVRAADPNLRATYKIEFLESKYDFSPWCSTEGTLGAGGMDSKTQDLGVCQSDPMYVRVTLRPHPLSDAVMTVAEASDVTVGDHVGLTATLSMRNGSPAPAEPEPTPTPEPTPGGDSTNPAPALLDEPVQIARGHLDVRLTQASGDGKLTYGLAVKDDSLTSARTSVLRTLGSTTLAVGPNARFVRPASLSDASYDVLGPVGAATYLLPETQNSDIVWPGLSTEGIDYASLPEGADLTLHLAEAPSGARVAFFQGGTFGAGARVHFDSAAGDGLVHTTESTHMHGNWVFSAPGTYRIEVGARSGERVLAQAQSFTVVVRSGRHDAQPAPTPGDDPVPAPSPGPSPTPDPAPTPDPTPDPAPAPDHTVGTWMNDGAGWWWKITSGGYAKNETLTLDGRVYRFDQNGYMLTGWVYWDGAWRYHNGAGAQVTGWVNLGGSWFYLTPETGAMATGWQMVADKWFFFASNGVMKTGWLYTNGAWYYLDPSGSMHTGWLQMGSYWYLMSDSGAMTIGWKPMGSTWYYFDASGQMATGWQQIGGAWYYFGTGGDMYTGGHWIGWRWYTFGSDGRWLG